MAIFIIFVSTFFSGKKKTLTILTKMRICSNKYNVFSQNKKKYLSIFSHFLYLSDYPIGTFDVLNNNQILFFIV